MSTSSQKSVKMFRGHSALSGYSDVGLVVIGKRKMRLQIYFLQTYVLCTGDNYFFPTDHSECICERAFMIFSCKGKIHPQQDNIVEERHQN
jgi:hypothetical protein